MPENDAIPADEKLLILPLGEESKKITQVISNDTARQILELLADAPLSASDIAERLKVPLTTIVYNLENLEKVGLIRVEKIKYSEKGREVKIYAPVRKLIVVVPEKADKKSVADLIRKYMGVILAAILASSIIEFFTRNMSRTGMMEIANYRSDAPASIEPLLPNVTSIPDAAINATAKTGEIVGAISTPTPLPTLVREAMNPAVTQAAAPPYVVSDSSTGMVSEAMKVITDHPGLLFFFGCIFVVIIFAMKDYLRKKGI